MESDAAPANLAAVLERSPRSLPLDSAASPVRKKQRTDAAAKPRVQQRLDTLFVKSLQVRGDEAGTSAAASSSAAASPQADIGGLSRFYRPGHHGIYGPPDEVKARQDAVDAVLGRRAIDTGAPSFGDERDPVQMVPDSSQPWGGAPVSAAVRNAAEGDPQRPDDVHHLLSMLQRESPDAADEFAGVVLDYYKDNGCITSTANWDNQTFAFLSEPALGRLITFDEFKGASQLPWEQADTAPNALLARAVTCMTRGKLHGGGPFQLGGEDKAAGKHSGKIVMTGIWPGGVTQSKEGWEQYTAANPAWREQITFSTRNPGLASKMQQVLMHHNLPRFRDGFLHLMRNQGNFSVQSTEGKRVKTAQLQCRLSIMPHALAHIRGNFSRVQPLAKKRPGDKAAWPKNSHYCRTSLGADCIAYGAHDFFSRLRKPKDLQHPDSPLMPHMAYFPSAAAEVRSDNCKGVIAEMFYKNGLFLTTMVTDCGLPQHRGFYPTGATASCCGKLTVRCSSLTWEQIKQRAPTDEYRAALEELVAPTDRPATSSGPGCGG